MQGTVEAKGIESIRIQYNGVAFFVFDSMH